MMSICAIMCYIANIASENALGSLFFTDTIMMIELTRYLHNLNRTPAIHNVDETPKSNIGTPISGSVRVFASE